MKLKALFIAILIGFTACKTENTSVKKTAVLSSQYITILGVAQDAGYPQIDCHKQCAIDFYNGKNPRQKVVSLGLVDKINKQKWLFDATPDMPSQLADLEQNHLKTDKLIDGIFLTHAHIGHYTGLMYLGKEAMNSHNIQVFSMPRMENFLKENGPWSQLVQLKNIAITKLHNDSTISLNNSLKVTPFLVPHRDEFSETVGYKITGENKTALFIPDINKWKKWEKNIIEEVKKVDYAFLDATFLKDGEVNRPMAEIPHPFIIETIALFKNESKATKNKIIFIHFNHTNPTMQKDTKEKLAIEKQGFHFAEEGQNYEL